MSASMFAEAGTYVGRVRVPGGGPPRIVTIRGDEVFDITDKTAPTVRDICEMPDPARYVTTVAGTVLSSCDDLMKASLANDLSLPRLLSPVDLQAIKAAGVTFAVSLLERVIEEQANGDAEKATDLRQEVLALVGDSLSALVPGSEAAIAIKTKLIERGIWSQYLEVGIGPDAEIFTKCQPMASVGHGADVGLHPVSRWNNSEPEVALVVSSQGGAVGATLGNDLNLRDVEGRSALLLGQAKDNNASAALGPFIRLFDGQFTLETVRNLVVHLKVEGEDGFILEGDSSMNQISRTPESLVQAALGPHHQYPDGMVLYLGTMFAPIADRDGLGKGFTHKVGDVVTIQAQELGTLVNRVNLSTICEPWTYGPRQFMADLANADLL